MTAPAIDEYDAELASDLRDRTAPEYDETGRPTASAADNLLLRAADRILELSATNSRLLELARVQLAKARA